MKFSEIKERVLGTVVWSGRKYGRWVEEKEYYYAPKSEYGTAEYRQEHEKLCIEFEKDITEMLYEADSMSTDTVQSILKLALRENSKLDVLNTIDAYHFLTNGYFL